MCDKRLKSVLNLTITGLYIFFCFCYIFSIRLEHGGYRQNAAFRAAYLRPLRVFKEG